MATRRDQLQSYQFMTQRVVSAFVMRETDPKQSPLRRGIGALFGGLMIAIVAGAAVGIYGLLTKVGSDNWKTDGSVVIEKETGASFVYLQGQLHPALNYASALLAAGKPGSPLFRVAGSSLAEVPRGVTVGIPGAPNSLPPADKRVGFPWTLCAIPGTDNTGRPTNTVALALSASPTGERRLGDEGLLVRDANLDLTYLVWHGRRYLVQEPRTVVPALFGAVSTVPAGTAWLNALPAGADIAPIAISSRGSASAATRGRRIGDVLVAQTGSGPQHYLVFNDGLAPITLLQYAILASQSATQTAPIAVSEATALPRSSRLSQPAGETAPPTSPPKLATVNPNAQVCASTTAATAPPELSVGGTVPGLNTAVPTGSTSRAGTPLADRIVAPGGRVTVLKVLGTPGAYSLVTDLGIRYAVPSDVALQLLGYAPDQVVEIPSTLISLIPAGPTLDPAAALRPATTNGQ
jgi:type VII secretion protein EccB